MIPSEIGPFLSRTTPRLLVVVFTVLAILFTLTGFLASSYKAEKLARAEQQYIAGQQLAEAGDYGHAINLYTEALTLKRNDEKYLQALATALVRAGRIGEAETYLKQLTRTDPANGVANHMLARIYADEGEYELAKQHYQRAIYGLWPDDPVRRRIEIRFELVELLERNEEFTEMVAELLRLLDDAPADPEVKKRIGKLFLSARAYDHAARIFQEVAEARPRDAEAFAGLGDAEFELGNYFSARTAYSKALSLNPDDLQSRTQYDLATEIISLNPMIRGLGSYTQLRRSQELVRRAREALAYCLPADLSVAPEEVRKWVDKADEILDSRRRQGRTLEVVETNIEVAERLEEYRQRSCGVAPVPDRALSLVLRQLAG